MRTNRNGVQEELRSLDRERASYVFLLGEMNPVPGSPVDTSIRNAIASVDDRINLIAETGSLPPVNEDILQRGHIG